MIVFLATGLWHGAGTSFLAWGLYWGALCAFEALVGWKRSDKAALRALQHALTLLLVLIGWVIFNSETLGGALAYLAGMVKGGGRMLYSLTPRVGLALALGALLATGLPGKLLASIPEKVREGLALAAAPALVLACLLSLASGAYNPFIYFRF